MPSERDSATAAVARRLAMEGDALWAAGDPGSTSVLMRAIARFEALEEPGNEEVVDFARTLNSLANVRFETGGVSAALDLIGRALELYEGLRPPAHRGHLEAVIDQARFVAVSNATRALKILDSALVAAERELGGDDLLEICAIIMTNRSNVLSSLGRLDDALADLHRASELDQSRGTPSLEVKLNIANRLADAGNPEAALGTVAPLLEESIRANLEDGTPVRALALFNASTYLDAMGRLDEARQCLEAAIDVLRHAGRSGRDHVEVKSTLAAAYYNLSVTHAQFGDLSAARAAARRSLDVYRELAAVSPEQFGADEREGAKLLDSLG